MFGKLNSSEIENLLYSKLIGRIGCYAEGKVYVVPMSYAYDGSCIYGHATEGLKINMMRKNPSVCFEIDDTHNLANWKSVIAWGQFEEIGHDEGKRYAIKLLEQRRVPANSSDTMHITAQWPFPADKADDVSGILFRICLLEKTGRFEKSDERYYFAT